MDTNFVGKILIGRYYLVKKLGRGSVEVTFLAQDKKCFDSLCVVKQLKSKSANPKTLEIARKLFNREAESMNRLGHCDRIPRLLGYFEHQNDFFLVQELIEGHDLSNEIIPGEPWSGEKTITLLKDILEVLLVVQQYSVIHGDLKPSNLMRRDKDNKIVLIDFGSVKQVSTQIIDAAGEINQTVEVGTKSYMPMEQMMDRPGFHSDIYAVGIIAIQALTGVPPEQYTVDRNGELIWRNLLNPTVNYQPQFLDLLDKMVRYRFQERYSAAINVMEDLEQLNALKGSSFDTVSQATKSLNGLATRTQVNSTPKSKSTNNTLFSIVKTLFRTPKNQKYKTQKESRFQISLMHPRRLAKGCSSVINVLVYLPSKRNDAVSIITELQKLENSEPIENTYPSALVPEQTVILKLSSPAISFSNEVLKKLRGEYINRVTFTAQPNNECILGRHSAVLSIRDAETNEEFESIPFFFIIDNFAFDHVSKPLLSYVSSCVSGLGSLTLFTLSLLQKVDATLGIPAGTVGAALALLLGVRPTFLYKNEIKTQGK